MYYLVLSIAQFKGVINTGFCEESGVKKVTVTSYKIYCDFMKNIVYYRLKIIPEVEINEQQTDFEKISHIAAF